MERDYTPEGRGDELRALNRGDDGNLRFLDVPVKGMASNASSSSDFMREDTSPIFRAAVHIAPVVSNVLKLILCDLDKYNRWFCLILSQVPQRFINSLCTVVESHSPSSSHKEFLFIYQTKMCIII